MRTTVRAVTHYGVTASDIETVINAERHGPRRNEACRCAHKPVVQDRLTPGPLPWRAHSDETPRHATRATIGCHRRS